MQEIKIYKNPYLQEDISNLESKAYFGEFLFALDFGDSFRYLLQKEFWNYIADIKSKNDNIDIRYIKDEINNIVKIVLQIDGIDEEINACLEQITTKLQKNYAFIPVQQKLNFEVEFDSLLPIELEKPEKNTKRYFRNEYQELIKKILIYTRKKEQNMDIISKLENKSKLSDLQSGIVTQLKNTNKIIEGVIEQKIKPDILEAREILQINNAIITSESSDVVTVLNPFQAGVLQELKDTKAGEKYLKLEEILKRIEKTTGENREFASSLKKELEASVLKAVEQMSVIGEFVGVEKEEINKGIICDYDVDSRKFFIEGRIVGKKESDVYAVGDLITGFSIEGLKIRIRNIKEVYKDNDILHTFLATLEDGTKKIYTIEDNKYVEFVINGINNNEIEGITVSIDKNKKINLGIISIEDYNYVFSYIDGRYLINNKLDYKGIGLLRDLKYDKTGKIESFIYGGNLVHKEGDSFLFLSIKDKGLIYIGDEANYELFFKENRLVAGYISGNKVFDYNGEYSYFYKKDGEFQFFHIIKGNTLRKKELELNEDFSVKLPQIIDDKLYAYENLNGEIEYLEIEGCIKFDAFKETVEMSTDKNGIPIDGFVSLSSSKRRFLKQGDKYVYERKRNFFGRKVFKIYK